MDLQKSDVRVGDKLVVGPLEYLQWGEKQGWDTVCIGLDCIADRVGTVSYVSGEERLDLVIGDATWCIPAWMLQHDFRWGQEIWISEDGLGWQGERFRDYVWGSNYIVNGKHKHARPIRQPVEPKDELLEAAEKVCRDSVQVDKPQRVYFVSDADMTALQAAVDAARKEK